jgi:hypothetical protein
MRPRNSHILVQQSLLRIHAPAKFAHPCAAIAPAHPCAREIRTSLCSNRSCASMRPRNSHIHVQQKRGGRSRDRPVRSALLLPGFHQARPIKRRAQSPSRSSHPHPQSRRHTPARHTSS